MDWNELPLSENRNAVIKSIEEFIGGVNALANKDKGQINKINYH